MTVDIFAPYRSVSTKTEARELADLLGHPSRDRPVVVVSSTKDGPRITPTDLATRLGSDADVYLLTSAAIAYDLDDIMPEGSSVYGGAVRCYPPGTAWTTETRKAVTRLIYTDEEAKAAIGLIADDVAAMATSFTTSSRPVQTPAVRTIDGSVTMLLEPDGALVKTDNGGIARIDTSSFAPGVPVTRLLEVGQRVTGTIHDGVLTLTIPRNTVADAVAHATAGTVLPAKVSGHKTVTLFPGLEVRHRSGMEPGHVVPVRIELSGRADGKAWRLVAADGETVTDALPILHGGEPWIRIGDGPAAVEPEREPTTDTETSREALPEPEQPLPEAEVPEPAPRKSSAEDAFAALELVRGILEGMAFENGHLTGTVEDLSTELDEVYAKESAPAAPVPAQTNGAELTKLRSQVAALLLEKREILTDSRRTAAEADALAAEVATLRRKIERLQDDVRTERERANHARQLARSVGEPDEGSILFTDPVEQFRHEVYLEWASRIPAASKAELPLADYDLADGFLDAVGTVQGVDRSKIVAVAVEVLTGLADTMPGRDMHRLRGGLPGTSTFVEHPVHGTAWRVALQIKTASARRMHFWRGNDGKVVFATVGVHDDMGI